uniref:MYND-type domain-containing protein n=1 Tax=Steinernema glaseri TaxID=37863 RepID=A0A1I8AR43_9BILA
MPSEKESGKADRIDFYPFAYALYNEELNSYCWHCLGERQGLRHCTGCGVALFCDKSCQTSAWKDHKAECKAIATHRYVANIETRFLGRIVLRFKDIAKGRDKKDPTFYVNRTSERSIMEIWSHAEQILKDEQGLRKFEEIYESLSKYYDEKFLLPKKVVFELHCRDFINRHAISDKGYLKEIGKGLYLDLCAYDHSCAPNTVYTCKGFIATLRPLNNSVNLRDRSNTFYSYIELFSTKQQRRKMLQDTWYFHCECTRCADNNDHMLTAMKCPFCDVRLGDRNGYGNGYDVETRLSVFGQQPYKDKLTQMLSCPQCKKEIPQEKVMEHVHAMRFVEDIFARKEVEQMSGSMAIEFLESLISRYRALFPKINLYYCKLIQALIPLVDPKDASKLLFLHQEVEECLRFCFPHAHPAIAFHLRNTGIFQKTLKHFDEAKKYFEEAQELLDYTLDPDHPMAIENRQFLDEVKRELTGEVVSTPEAPKATELSTNKTESEIADEQRRSDEAPPPTETFVMTSIRDMLEDHFDEIPDLFC